MQSAASLPAKETEAAGLIPLAMPLLQLMARLRTMASEPDAEALRARVEAELARFETRAAAAGVPEDQVRRAHYALCASLDDLVLNTPWGAAGAWADRPLVTSLHAAVGPDRLFDLLRQAQEKIGSLRPVLELMVVCLSLGVMGRYRGAADGAAAVERIRGEAAAALAAGAPPVPPLSARWEGVAARFVPRRSRLPVWVAASAGLAVVAGLFLALSLRLNDRSDALFARMLGAPPSHMPEVTRQPPSTPPPAAPEPAEPSLQDRLRARLEQAVAAGSVVVAGTPTTPVLRIAERAVFDGAGVALAPGAPALLAAVSAALQPEGGRLLVAGYSDNRPVHSVLFPSAFQLSAARARAVRDLLVRGGADPARVGAEGRASANPVASNASPEGREQNRRIEIVLDQVGS